MINKSFVFFKKTDSLVLLVYLVGQLFFDFFQKINTCYDFGFLPYHRYIKAVLYIYICVSLITVYKDLLESQVFKIVMLILFIFLVANNFSESRIEYFLQYSFFLILALFFSIKRDLQFVYIIKFLKAIVLVNFVFILIGSGFNLVFFKTYLYRNGFNGMLITSMQSTVFYFSVFALFIQEKLYFYVVITLISALLVGTKTLVFGIPLLVFLDFLLGKKKIDGKTILLYFIFCLVGVIAIFNSNLFIDLIEKHRALTVFFSFRDQLLLDTMQKIKPTYSISNFFIGGIDFSGGKTELDLIDVFLFFGLLGTILFGCLFIKLKSLLFTTRAKAYFFTIIVAALFSGNILSYPFNTFLFLLLLKIMYENEENQHT
jgi:hypothetical protein